MRRSFNATLGARIRATRDLRSLTQRELARQSSLRSDGLSKIEGGIQPPTVCSLWRIAQALSVPVDYLLPGIDFEEESDRLLYCFLRDVWDLPKEARRAIAVLLGCLGTFVEGLKGLPFDFKTGGSHGPSLR